MPSAGIMASWVTLSTGDCVDVDVFDDFERADGVLGSDWAAIPIQIEPSSYTMSMPNISGGNVVGPPQDGTVASYAAAARWATPLGVGDQYVEVVVGGMKPPAVSGASSGRIWLFTQMDATDGSRASAYVFQQRSSLDITKMNFGKEINSYDSTGEFFDLPWHEYTDELVPGGDPVHTFVLESDVDGDQRLYVDGVLVGTTPLVGEDSGPVTGPYVGFQIFSNDDGSRPWIESFAAGMACPCAVAFGEDWVGDPAGPLDANWIEAETGPSHGPLEIDSIGTAVAPTLMTGGMAWGNWSFSTTSVSGDYFAAIQIFQMGGESGGSNQLVSVFVNFDLVTCTGLEWSYVISSTSPGDGNLRRNTWVDGVQTSSAVQDHIDTPAILRVEKRGDTYTFMYLPIGGSDDYVAADESDWPEFAGGDHCGMRADWDDPAPVSPQIDGFEIGCL